MPVRSSARFSVDRQKATVFQKLQPFRGLSDDFVAANAAEVADHMQRERITLAYSRWRRSRSVSR